MRLERDLIQQELVLADVEKAFQAEVTKCSQLRMQSKNGEAEVRLVKRALVAKRAQAEASLESSEEYKALVEAIVCAKKRVDQREQGHAQASRQLSELRGALVYLTAGMSTKGHAPASALRILLEAGEPVPLQALKEQLSGHLAHIGLNKGREAQQVATKPA